MYRINPNFESMEHEIRIEKTFRFETLNAQKNPKKVLYVLHGYGPLVKYFIRKFAHLPDDYLVVAPEGMHRFYLSGSSGRVGASWMTKEARTSDIWDTMNYLNQLDAHIAKEFDITERYLLGFSQGGATAARWYELGSIHFNAVALWGCVFPPDLPVTKFQLSSKRAFFLIGDHDEFYADKQHEIVQIYETMGVQTLVYEGGHDLVNETLTQLLKKMEGIE